MHTVIQSTEANIKYSKYCTLIFSHTETRKTTIYKSAKTHDVNVLGTRELDH